MYKYRFKTEKEFIEEFGVNWRNKVRYMWVNGMDYLLGTEIPSSNVLLSEDNSIKFIVESWKSWNISENMVTLIKKTPNYNPKKISYE